MEKSKSIITKRLNKAPKFNMIIIGSKGQKDKVVTIRPQSSAKVLTPTGNETSAVVPSHLFTIPQETDTIDNILEKTDTTYGKQNQLQNEIWEELRGPTLQGNIIYYSGLSFDDLLSHRQTNLTNHVASFEVDNIQ